MIASAGRQRGADRNDAPAEPAAENALRDFRHQERLRRRERVGLRARGARDSIGVEQQIQHRRDDKRGCDRADQNRDLERARRRADVISGRQIVHRVARHRSGGANHRTRHDREARANARRDTEHLQHQREREQNDYGHAGNWIVRCADEAGQISGHRGREKSDDREDHRHREAEHDTPSQHHAQRENHRQRQGRGGDDGGRREIGVFARGRNRGAARTHHANAFDQGVSDTACAAATA